MSECDTVAVPVLRRRLFGQPIFIWLLWAAAAVVLVTCPMMLSDPAMWCYLLDPEMLALVVIVGFRYTRLEFELLRLRIRARLGTPSSDPEEQASACALSAPSPSGTSRRGSATNQEATC